MRGKIYKKNIKAESTGRDKIEILKMWWPFWHFEVKFKTNRCKVELKQRE
jgi:hypothetical protein